MPPLRHFISFQYRKYGYDVRTYSYNVLLNYPNYGKPNHIEVNTSNGHWVEMSSGLAERLGPKEALEQACSLPQFLF